MYYNKLMVVILHNIRSAHNVGSMFRTADAVGIEKIYISGITPIPLDRFGKVRSDIAKVALGGETSVPWEHSKSILRLIKKLKKERFCIVALEQSDTSISYRDASLKRKKKIALIVGNEVKGIPHNILELSDIVMEIPMKGNKESLNVSVAFGIAVYQLTT